MIFEPFGLDLEPFGLPGLDLEPFGPPELDLEPFGPPGLDLNLKAFRPPGLDLELFADPSACINHLEGGRFTFPPQPPFRPGPLDCWTHLLSETLRGFRVL